VSVISNMQKKMPTIWINL